MSNHDVTASGAVPRPRQPRQIAYRLAAVAVLNTFIAVFLGVFGFTGFGEALLFSQCIGLSIFAVLEIWRAANVTSRLQPLVYAAGILLGSLIGTLLAALATGDFASLLDWPPSALWRAVLAGLLFGGLAAAAFAYQGKLHRTREALHAEQMRLVRAEQAQTEAQLRLLRAQVEPHFLFNTLATVASLIEAEPREARRLLEQLNDYLRDALHHSRATRTTVGQEVDLVRDYLDLMQVRLSGRLRYAIDVPAALRERELPPMALQPLVENAVKHGIEPKLHGGTVTVSARDGAQNATVLEVSDDGAGLSPGGAGGGTGLANLRNRLRSLHGGAARLSIEENTAGGVTVRLVLPAERDA